MIKYYIIVIILFLIYYFFFKKKNLKNKIKLIFFNSSWCFWSKKLLPILNEIKNDKNIEVIEIKCDLNINKKICDKYKIYEYPTIKLINNDKIIDYTDDVNLHKIKLFIKNNI